MIVSSIKSNEPKPKSDFPKLMFNNDYGKLVVIFATNMGDDGNIEGYVVYSYNTSIWPIGYISYVWPNSGFEDYHGEIILKNK